MTGNYSEGARSCCQTDLASGLRDDILIAQLFRPCTAATLQKLLGNVFNLLVHPAKQPSTLGNEFCAGAFPCCKAGCMHVGGWAVVQQGQPLVVGPTSCALRGVWRFKLPPSLLGFKTD